MDNKLSRRDFFKAGGLGLFTWGLIKLGVLPKVEEPVETTPCPVVMQPSYRGQFDWEKHKYDPISDLESLALASASAFIYGPLVISSGSCCFRTSYGLYMGDLGEWADIDRDSKDRGGDDGQDHS